MRSRIEPMKKIARSLRQHRELILNYFRAQKLISCGVVEGLNNKAKVTIRKSYSFRTYRVLELALYHSLANYLSRYQPTISSDESNSEAIFRGLLNAKLGSKAGCAESGNVLRWICHFPALCPDTSQL